MWYQIIDAVLKILQQELEVPALSLICLCSLISCTSIQDIIIVQLIFPSCQETQHAIRYEQCLLMISRAQFLRFVGAHEAQDSVYFVGVKDSKCVIVKLEFKETAEMR